jgi:hypothetical protein
MVFVHANRYGLVQVPRERSIRDCLRASETIQVQ